MEEDEEQKRLGRAKRRDSHQTRTGANLSRAAVAVVGLAIIAVLIVTLFW